MEPDPAVDDTGTTATENLAAIASFGEDGRRVRVLVDMRSIRTQSRDARLAYGGPAGARVVSAAALIVGSPLSRLLGNFFLGLNKALYPTRLVEDEAAGVQWLTQHLPPVKP